LGKRGVTSYRYKYYRAAIGFSRGKTVIEKVYSIARGMKRKNYPGKALVNSMYHDPSTVILTTRNFDFVEVDGCKFFVNDQLDSIQRIEGNPWFRNMRETDIGVDIGANMGAITIPMAKRMKWVYAVEPLFGDILKANLELNCLSNVTVLECGIGYPAGVARVEFGPRQGKMKVHTFEALKRYVGKIDWLKIDGEGCEWDIDQADTEDVRELRIEFHIRRNKRKEDYLQFEIWKAWLGAFRYDIIETRGAVPGPCVPFSECILLNASKKDI
jgi:FkbM family methyltransferase